MITYVKQYNRNISTRFQITLEATPNGATAVIKRKVLEPAQISQIGKLDAFPCCPLELFRGTYQDAESFARSYAGQDATILEPTAQERL